MQVRDEGVPNIPLASSRLYMIIEVGNVHVTAVTVEARRGRQRALDL